VKDKKYLFYDPPPQNHCHPRYHLDQNQPELDVFQQDIVKSDVKYHNLTLHSSYLIFLKKISEKTAIFYLALLPTCI
jgi:hypothetical protein